ncbi:hypothetical protein [Aestuariibaculum sp. M13]|uniref:hypothetical protein n=1 Tax=Aestuariibaculum sp. M13 TaxID=2967132 RepID=UPI002159F84C|nr:hypothetical protein [Aestuariibaculum sp. M13]
MSSKGIDKTLKSKSCFSLALILLVASTYGQEQISHQIKLEHYWKLTKGDVRNANVLNLDDSN